MPATPPNSEVNEVEKVEKEKGGSCPVRALGALLLASVVLSSTGCSLLFRNGVSIRRDFLLVDPLDKQGPRDRFYEWRGKKKFDPLLSPFGIGVAPIHLRQPFTFEARVGIFDPDDRAASDLARGCIEIDEDGTFGALGFFFFMCVVYEATPVSGIRVVSNVDANELFYPGVYGGLARFEADPTTLTLRFQPQGTVGFDNLTSTPFSKTSPYYPSFGAVDVFKRGVVNFDRFDYTSTPLAAPTLEQDIGEDIESAMQHLNRACNVLDEVSDFAQAQTEIQSSFTFITWARANLEMLPDPVLSRQVGKKLDCMDRLAFRALRPISEQREDPALGKLGASLRCGGEGLVRLRNFALDF